MKLGIYKKLLGDIPEFLNKYLSLSSIERLKDVGYFCGMDYASKDIYDFGEYVSRYDHSLNVALITWNLTKDKSATLAGLFHDISTPCFAHVIDYMNKDYNKQESTEIYTKDILIKEKNLIRFLKEDGINLNDIIDFKGYTIVDNDRPKLCADRLDGIILTGLFWTKGIDITDVKNIIDSVEIYKNEYDEDEIGFNNYEIKKYIMKVNDEIDLFCHSKEDNYMMELLASITKKAINKNIINYKDLYMLKENELLDILDSSSNNEINEKLNIFREIKLDKIPDINLTNVKKRLLNPLVNGLR